MLFKPFTCEVSESCTISEVGAHLQGLSSPISFSNRATYSRLLRAVAHEFFYISADGDSTATFGNSIYFFLIFKLYSLYLSLYTLSLLLSLGTSLTPLYSFHLVGCLHMLLKPLEPSLLQAKQSLLSQALLVSKILEYLKCLHGCLTSLLSHSSSSISLLYLEAQNWAHHSKLGHERAE